MTRCINPDIDISEMPHPNTFEEARWYPHAKPARCVPSTQTPHIVMSSSNKTYPARPTIRMGVTQVIRRDDMDDIVIYCRHLAQHIPARDRRRFSSQRHMGIWDGSTLGTRHENVRRVEPDVDGKQLQGFVNRVVNISRTSKYGNTTPLNCLVAKNVGGRATCTESHHPVYRIAIVGFKELGIILESKRLGLE